MEYIQRTYKIKNIVYQNLTTDKIRCNHHILNELFVESLKYNKYYDFPLRPVFAPFVNLNLSLVNISLIFFIFVFIPLTHIQIDLFSKKSRILTT